MLQRLQDHWLEIPLVWPGTREQAETIVRALTPTSLGENERDHLVEAVQSGARDAWQHLVAQVPSNAFRDSAAIATQ
jgi:hypothetical protein